MIKKISSEDNIVVKKIKKLFSKASYRNSEELYIIEGKRIVYDTDKALIDTVCVSEDFYNKNKQDLTYEKLIVISDKIFTKITDTVNSQGIIALAKICTCNEDEIKKAEKILFLDAVSDPGNMGTIIRTAEASGTDMIIIGQKCVDIFNPKVVRSGMGSISRQKIYISKNNTEVLNFLRKDGFEIVATTMQDAVNYDNYNYSGKQVVILGSEAFGISDEILSLANNRIYIPMKGNIESLNVSIAAALIMYKMTE